MPDALARRLLELATEQEGPFARGVTASLGERAPVIWLTLRSHSRRWVGQRDGLVHLIKAVRRSHPRCAFILDGLAAEGPLADAILQRLGQDPDVLDCTGSSIHQALALFHHADAFVMPFSNAAFLTMVVPKPGVFHGIHGWFPAEPFSIVPRQASALAVPVTGTLSPSGDAAYDVDPCTADYEVDWHELVDALRGVLGDRGDVSRCRSQENSVSGANSTRSK